MDRIGKKGAAEVFNLVIPILIFIIFVIVMMVISSIVLVGSGKDGSIEGNVRIDHMVLPSLLSYNLDYKEHENHLISLYEVLYYGEEDKYLSEIEHAVDMSEVRYGSYDLNYFLVIYKTDKCEGDKKVIPSGLLQRTNNDKVKQVIINGRCIILKRYEEYKQYDIKGV